jgi:hypothetical protein
MLLRPVPDRVQLRGVDDGGERSATACVVVEPLGFLKQTHPPGPVGRGSLVVRGPERGHQNGTVGCAAFGRDTGRWVPASPAIPAAPGGGPGARAADPVVLAALRIAAGPHGRSLEADIALLGRLADLPGDDAAHALRLLPVLANAITSTYDDQTLIHASHMAGDTPTPALRAAAQRLGGEGGPPWTPRPVPAKSSRNWSGPKERYSTGAYPHAQQRPVLPEGTAGVLAAVRDCSSKAYDDPPGPRWSADALANAVGRSKSPGRHPVSLRSQAYGPCRKAP